MKEKEAVTTAYGYYVTNKKKRSPQERKLLKNRKKAHKVPIGVISHFFTVNNFFISTPSERSFSPDVVYTYGIS